MLELVKSKECSVALSVIVQELPHQGWTTFPGFHVVLETPSELHADAIALLGYNPSNQMTVVDKILAFLGKIAHMAVADMMRMHRDEHLAQMWYQSDTTEHLREKCEDVCRLFFCGAFEFHVMQSYSTMFFITIIKFIITCVCNMCSTTVIGFTTVLLYNAHNPATAFV